MRYFLISLLFVASTANAETWQPIGKLDSSGAELLLDVAGITEVKGLRRAWLKAVYTSDQPIPTEYWASIPKDVRTYRQERTLRYFNCADRTSAVMRYFWSDADDKSGGYFYRELLTFHPAQSGTPDELMNDAVCNFAGPLVDAKTAKLHMPGEEEAKARLRLVMNPDDYYPSGAKWRKEEGAPVVQVCVDSKGGLREVTISETSGFPDLDAAAIKAAQGNFYLPGMKDGVALPESCVKYKIRFTLKHR